MCVDNVSWNIYTPNLQYKCNRAPCFIYITTIIYIIYIYDDCDFNTTLWVFSDSTGIFSCNTLLSAVSVCPFWSVLHLHCHTSYAPPPSVFPHVDHLCLYNLYLNQFKFTEAETEIHPVIQPSEWILKLQELNQPAASRVKHSNACFMDLTSLHSISNHSTHLQ